MKDFANFHVQRHFCRPMGLVAMWVGMICFSSFATTLIRYVSSASDDAGNDYHSYYSFSANEIYMGQCQNGNEITSGFRFIDLSILSPSEIANVFLEFTTDGPYQDPIILRIYGEASDHSLTFGVFDKPSDRSLTSTYVDWVLTTADVWSFQGRVRTPDLAPILREIVNRRGWRAGNAISFIIKTVGSTQAKHRRVYAFEREGMSKAAKLIVNEVLPSADLYTIRPRVMVIDFDPKIPSAGNALVSEIFHWNNPTWLGAVFKDDVEQDSHGIVQYQISKYIRGDYFPIKSDGFRYTTGSASEPGSYLYAMQHHTWHQPDAVDYYAFVRDYDLGRRVDFGEVDEYWIFGGPYFGYWESHMAGKGAYFVNSPPMTQVAAARLFVMFGFNYERGVGEMLENLGHRTESIMTHVYGSWSADPTHAWNRFTLHEQIRPGGAACGNVHWAPNSQYDYDWGNTRYVWSTHNDWLYNYPLLTGQREWVNCAAWGNGDIRLHHKWWFQRLPHVEGTTMEYGMVRLNNWWDYIYDFNRYPESGSTLAPGSFQGDLSKLDVHPFSRNGDDWRPQINQANFVVWHGFCGDHSEIFSARVDGSQLVQLTNGNYSCEYPVMNRHGRVVWQSYDGNDYEIFSANADGSDIIQLTDNSYNDWHPSINDSGIVVWDGWDGNDYEIFSAKYDGSQFIQITNHAASGGQPRDDIWPQINNQGRVVWMGYDGSQWHIFSASRVGTDLRKISSGNYRHEYPRINNNNQVVWHAWHSLHDAEIHGAGAIPSAGSDHVISANPYEDWYPQINDSGIVVWMGHNGVNWNIYRAQYDGSNRANISNSVTDQQHPQIDHSGWVAWQGYDGNDWEIFAYKDGHVYQMTNNDINDRAPDVANGHIVWHGDSGVPGSSDIFSHIEYGNSLKLGVKIWLQGFYRADDFMSTSLNDATLIPLTSPYADKRTVDHIPAQTVDWVYVQLSTPATGEIEAEKSFFIRRDGVITEIDGNTTELTMPSFHEGNYNVMVKHRNHLSATSATPIFLESASTCYYDFTIGQTQYRYPESAINIALNKWGVKSGDIDQDTYITTTDYLLWHNERVLAPTGYLTTDLDGNGLLDQQDFEIWWQNACQGSKSLP